MHRLSASVAFVAAVLVPAIAWPCGGLFCSGGVNNPPPVIQTGEKILFGFENGDVTAHVQILYSGEPRKFAWVVPTPALPTLSVGSDQLFTLLDQGTMPTFTAQFSNSCSRSGPSLGCGSASPSFGGGGFADAGSSGVTVISEEAVGPFQTAILTATDPKAVQTWLQANGFDVSPTTDELLAPYVAKGNHFVALKLQSGKSIGDLQPIVLKYKSTEGPCVPIRLTAAAAQPDMGIAVFILGAGRGVPINYLHLVLNEARINWMTRGANYASVVTAAADEAGGRGFVTDFAGPNAPVRTLLTTALGTYRRSDVSGATPDSFVKAVRAAGFLGSSQNVLSLLQRCVPIPAMANPPTPIAFYQQWESYESQVTQTVVDQPKCGDDFDQLVVEPLRSAEVLMGRLPTLTRLYTSMSPNEMTEDPIFVINPDLPDVTAARRLPGELVCDNSGAATSAIFTGTNGDLFNVPFGAALDKAPALMRAEKMSERGAPVTTLDNTERAKEFNRTTVRGLGGCVVVGGSSLIAFGVVVLVLVARRRRWSA